MSIDVKIIDLDRVYSTVEGLSDINKDKAIKSGLSSAAYVFLSGGKRRLRQRMKSPYGVTGNLLRSFTVRTKRIKLGALAGFKATKNVGDAGLSEDGAKGYHAHLVDRGTAARQNYRRSNANRGIMPGNSFWMDTVEQDKDKAIEKLYSGVERAVNKIKNRQ